MAARTFRDERAMVIGTQIRRAKQEREVNGNKLPAEPEKGIVSVVTGTDYNEIKGYRDPLIVSYVFEDIKEIANYTYGQNVIIEFEQNGNYPPKGIEIYQCEVEE